MKNKIIVQCGLKIEDEYWFVAGNVNGLFKKNLLTKQIEFVDFFLEYNKLAFRLYSGMVLVDNKIIFAPCHTEMFVIYDLKERKFSKIETGNMGEEPRNQYLRLVAYKDSVYYIPFCASSFIKYSVRNESAKVLDEWNAICNKYADPEIGNFIIETICINRNCIYMFTSRNNRVVILDMETDRFWMEELNISAEEYITSVYLRNQIIWIITDANKIYRWNIVSGEQDSALDFGQSSESPEFYTHYLYVTDQYLYQINVFDKNIRMFDFLNNEASIIDMNEYVADKKDEDLSLYYYFDIHCIGDNLYLQSYYDGKYIKIDGKKVVDICEEIYIPEEYWSNFDNGQVSEGNLNYLDISIPEWLCRKRDRDLLAGDKNMLQGTFGKKIYDSLMKDDW